MFCGMWTKGFEACLTEDLALLRWLFSRPLRLRAQWRLPAWRRFCWSIVRNREIVVMCLRTFFSSPLAIAWAGFIASATHLGTPANALHAINGLGRSPLSNEVVSAVAFLFFAGMAWMYSYREKPKASVMNGLLAISIVCVIVMLFHTSFAYSIATVPTWDTWLTPANLCATALLSGPALATTVLQAARVRAGKWPYALLLIAVAALAAGTVLLVCHMNFLGTVGNNVTLASALVPNYGWLIAAHAALAICGWHFSCMVCAWQRRARVVWYFP